MLGFATNQLVNRHIQRFANQIPQSQVDTADRIDGDARLSVRHTGALKDVPDAFGIERIFARSAAW